MAASAHSTTPSRHHGGGSLPQNLFPLQYRTCERIYAIESRPSGLTIKISTLAQKSFITFPILSRDVDKSTLGEEGYSTLMRSLSQRTPEPLLRLLLTEKLLPPEPLPDLVRSLLPSTSNSSPAGAASAGSDTRRQAELESAKRTLLALIEKKESTLVRRASCQASKGNQNLESTSSFLCPITYELFKDPVQDEHGHTFEKSAIEQHFASNGRKCPINRQPIQQLHPNLSIKSAIEEMQSGGGSSEKKAIVPTLALFKKENLRLANRHLETVKDLLEEEE